MHMQTIVGAIKWQCQVHVWHTQMSRRTLWNMHVRASDTHMSSAKFPLHGFLIKWLRTFAQAFASSNSGSKVLAWSRCARRLAP
jgi:hypothetical protein